MATRKSSTETSRLRAAKKGSAKKAVKKKARPRKKPAGKVNAAGVTSDEQFLRETLGAQFAKFELERATNGYIEILEACYKFAKGDENPAMPAGYKVVAKIRTRAEEGLESMRALPAADLAALENDFRAVGISGNSEEGISNPENFGFVVRELATNALIVGIRGTQTPAEWVKNFTVIPQVFNAAPEFGLVHLGFEQMWKKIRRDVVEALEREPDTTRITFLGHSLGGAMATLGIVDVKKNLKRPLVDLCTFGGPRVGKVVFRVKFNKLIQDCFRVVEIRDIVPHVPSKLTLWNHVGREIEVRSKESNAHSLKSYLAGLKGLSSQEKPEGMTERVRGGVLTTLTY